MSSRVPRANDRVTDDAMKTRVSKERARYKPTRPETTSPHRQPTRPETAGTRRQPTRPETANPHRQSTRPETAGPRRQPTRPETASPHRQATRPETASPNRQPTRPETAGPRRQHTRPGTAGPRHRPTRPSVGNFKFTGIDGPLTEASEDWDPIVVKRVDSSDTDGSISKISLPLSKYVYINYCLMFVNSSDRNCS